MPTIRTHDADGPFRQGADWVCEAAQDIECIRAGNGRMSGLLVVIFAVIGFVAWIVFYVRATMDRK
jgi:hypothetical protein